MVQMAAIGPPLSKEDGPRTQEEECMRYAGYPLPRSSEGYLVGCDYDDARHLKGCAYGRKISKNSCKTYWRAVARVLQYLRRIQELGVTYGGRKYGGMEMNAYVDSGYATCPDSRRSVTGRAVLLGEGATTVAGSRGCKRPSLQA